MQVSLLAPLLLAALPQSAQPLGADAINLRGTEIERDVDVEAFGVLRRIGLLCVAFESDAGELFVLTDRGESQVGDRVLVRGDFAGPGVCGNLIVNRVVNTIDAAFAGTGTLVLDRALGLALETPEGARYGLFAPHGLSVGDELFVRGRVIERTHPITAERQHWIVNTVMGEPFTGFGRLVDSGSGLFQVTLDDGSTLALDGPGYAFASDGDYVFVEGIVDLTTSPPTLTHNTSRRALEAPGDVVDAGSGTPAFKAETIIFDDLFSLDSFGSFQIGERAFVRGRMLDDYDPLELRNNLIRSARIEEEFSGCGTIFADLGGEGSGLSFQATSGETFELESIGDITTEPFVYVAGALDPTGTRFVHNRIAPCLEIMGTLQFGFECTPLFVAQAASEGASYLLLENLGPYQVGDTFCVRGGLMTCDIGCPTPCLMANDVNDCTQ